MLIVLDSTIVFTKRIELKNPSKDQIREEIEHYADQMPFENGQRAVIYLKNDRLLQLFAVNALIFQGVQEALRRSGRAQVHSYHAGRSVYQIDFTAKPAEVIDQFLDDSEVLRALDFSTTNIT